MAFLWQNPESKFWIARFADNSGTRRNRSTKVPIKGATRTGTESNRKQAQKIADAFETAARKKQTVAQMRKVISELQQEITGEALVSQTVRNYVETWLPAKQAGKASATASYYRNVTDKLLAFLGDRADRDIAEITRQDMNTFRGNLAKTLAPRTANHNMKVLRMFFRDAKRDLTLLENPCEFVETLRQRGGSKRRPFTLPELKAVLGVAGEEWRSMILFGFYTGQRLGDIASLTWQNVDLAGGNIRFVTRKTGKTMMLPIASPLLKHLEEMPAGDDPAAPLHPNAFATVAKQGRSGNLSNQFGDLLAQAGLRAKQTHKKQKGGKGRGAERDTSGLSFHCLRHTAVSLLKEKGIPQATVMEYIGHDSEQMSQHYTTVGTDAMNKAAAAFPDLLEPEAH